MIEIPKSPKQFDKDTGEFSPCLVCGRPIKSENYKSIRVFYGDTAMLGSDVIKAYAENKQEASSADMYWLPIGSECLRNYPKLKPYTEPFVTDIGTLEQSTDKKEQENKLFLSEIANNKELLKEYPILGTPRQILQVLQRACIRGTLNASKAKLNETNKVDSWQVDPTSDSFKAWYSRYKRQPVVVNRMRKLEEKGKNMIVSQSDNFQLASPVGGVNGVVDNPPVKGIPQVIVDAMGFKLVAVLIRHAGLSKGCYTVNLYGCVGSDDKAHFDVTNGFMSDTTIADGGYYHLARYEVLNQPPPFKKLYYECNWSHSEVAGKVPNRVMPNKSQRY